MKILERTKTGKEINHLESGDKRAIKEGQIVRLVGKSQIGNSEPRLAILLEKYEQRGFLFLVRGINEICDVLVDNLGGVIYDDGNFTYDLTYGRSSIDRIEKTHPDYKKYLQMLEEAGI